MQLFTKSHIPLFLLGLVYLFTRLYNLLLLPIFTDESIYIYWSKVIQTTHSQWGLSLTDGKPPLLTWIIAIFLQIFPSDWYLLAGRLPSVLFGLITLLGIYKLTKLLFIERVTRGGEPHGRGPLVGGHGAAEWQDPRNRAEKIALLAGVLYILNPFSLLYDRLALFDSLLTSMTIWTVIYTIKSAKETNYKNTIFWGIFLGLAFLSKPTAIIFFFLTPLLYLIYARAEIRTNWKRIISHILVALSLGQIINNLQRLSSVYYLFEAKNQQFQQPLEKLLKEPFTLTWGNLNGFFSWIIPYYTWPIFIVGLFAFVVLIWQKRKQGLILLLLWFTPIFILATVGREIFPRYILFTTPYFLISVAYLIILITDPALAGTDRAKRGLIKLILTLIILLPSLHFDYLLLTNPPKAPLPKTDYHQYISEHPSGYGLDKIFTFLDDELKKEPVTLVTQGTFGLYHYAFLLEYWDNPNITIVPRWPLSVLDQEIFDRAKSQKTYILLKEHEEIPPQLPLKLVLKAEKPGGKYPLLLTTLK